MSPYDEYRPDWAFWRVLPAVELWEAVALSLNIEPRVLLAHPAGGGSAGVAVSLIHPQELYERFDLARRCAGATLPATGAVSGGQQKVTLQAFAKWATDIQWDLPEELRTLLTDGSAVVPVVGENADPFMRTGAPGRPTKGMPVVRAEFDRRRAADECKSSLREEAAHLESWFCEHYKVADPVSAKTIENNIRDDYRRWRDGRPKPSK